MRTNFTLLSFVLLLLLTTTTGFAQQFWIDDMEGASPSAGSRTSSSIALGSGGPPHTRYFKRVTFTPPTTLDINAPGYNTATIQGTGFWAAEDNDGAPTGASGGQPEDQSVTWGTISIAGKTGLSFSALFATGGTAGWDHGTASTVTDYMRVEYNIDNTGWINILEFRPNVLNSPGGQLAVDTNGDGLGDGTVLTTSFTEFTASIPGTGTNMQVRITVLSNTLGEEAAFDNIRLLETPSCTAPTITANPPNRAICAGSNTTFTASATGATAYQWQENTGSGFTNLPNVAPYSNVTTTTLTITGVTAGMSGYQYRLVAINGVASCFTNTNVGTLTVSSVNTSTFTQTNVSCNGGSNGTATVIPSGGISPYTYSWSPSGGTGATASGLTAGSYTVTVTDNISCQGTRNFTITQPPALNGSTVVTNVACNGGTTGAINLTPSGGTPGYTFNWGGGVTTEDRTGLAAATYAVIITDANSCTRNVTGITVTQPTSAVSGTTVVTNVACNGGTNGAINLTPTGGVGPYTFNWASGPTTEDRTGLSAGTYSVTITDANGCTGTVNATVTQPTSAVSGTTVVTNVACNGGNTGAINLTPTGGTGPYTFNWGGGVTTEDRTGLTAGTYSVIITDANGCTGTVSPTVTQPTAVSGTTVVTNVACFGGNTGAINLTPTGGTGPYTFNWGGGVTTEDRTSLTAGTYSVTITDANACTGTVTPTVTQPAAAVSGTTVTTNVACFGGNTGAINLTPTGGVGPYTFNWASGPTTEDRTGLIAGSYSVTITDANACTGTVNVTVTQPAAAVSGTTVVTNVACFGGNTGAINLTPTGGVGPYTFNWTGGVTTEDRTGLTAGTYSVTITDANGCTGTVTPTVTQPAAAVSGTTVVTNIACFGGNTGSINLTPTGGTGPYTFNWGGGITTEDRTGLTAGTYSVTITDANGCTGTVSPTVTQPASAVSGTTVVTNVACFGGTNGAINLTPTGGVGPYTFNWVSGPTTEDRTGLAAGTYSVTITDANACTGTVNATVTQPTSAVSGTTVVTNVSCFGGSNGAINLTPNGGTGPYTFNWASGPTTEDRTGLAAGTYSVTITDANGCTGTVNATVTQPAAAVSGTTLVTNVACFGGSNATINLTPTGGTGPYTFNWGGGITTEDRTGLVAGSYSVIVTDVNGCTGTVNATVTQPTAISMTAASQTNVACFGGATGAAAVNAATGGAGGFTYDWTPGTPTGDGTTSVTGLTAGTWTVTTTDANGCTASQSFTVTQPPALVATAAAQTNVSCFGGSNGSATVSATGGTPGYTYSWSPAGGTGATASGLAAGTYTVTITDANGCSATQSFTITQPPVLVATAAAQTNVSCFGGSNGSATVTVTGGTPGYTYSWSPAGGTGATASGLAAGTYTVTVTDANGCMTTQSFTVTQPPVLVVSPVAQTNVSCFGGSNGSATVTVTGGTPGYTYSWAPYGGTAATATGLVAGTYTVTATDANGCTATQSFTVTEPTAIVLTAASQTNAACNGAATGAAAVNAATGGTGVFTYDWTPGSPTGDGTTSVTGLTAGTYTVVATDQNGCTATQSFTITQPAAITSSVSATECDTYTLNGTTYNTSGVYTQTLTAANGCDSTLTLNLTILESTSATLTETACVSYTLNGQTYTASGTYTQMLTNAATCDSTLTLNLTITQPTAETITDTACVNYTLNGTMYTVSGTYTQMLTNAAGCDSTLTLNLTILQPTAETITDTACASYTLNGQTYTSSGTYTQTLSNAAGCDSTLTLALTILDPTSSTLSETACDSYSLNGQTYTVSGTYTQMLTNAAGCDSTITLNLVVLNSTSSTQSATACDSYTLNGQTYTASGTYTQLLTNAAGCDSTITLNLTIDATPVAGIVQTDAVTLQATGNGTAYQWIDCDNGNLIAGATSATFTFSENGSYAVIVSNGNCADTSACIVVDEVSLDEMATAGIVIAPNPTSDVFTVTMTGMTAADVVIYDAQGKVVMTVKGAVSGETISLGNMQRGMYLVHVSTANGTHVERLMKQ